MNLSQIIAANEANNQTILIELLLPYKKSLYTYYKNQFCNEPVLMVTDVFNAAQYGKIVPCDELEESINCYLENTDLNEEEKADQQELISFQSFMLNKL